MATTNTKHERLPWSQLRRRYWPARAILCSIGLHQWMEYPQPDGKPHGAFCLRCWAYRRAEFPPAR
jgi:hypothetical protein